MTIEIAHKGLILDCTLKTWERKYEAGFEVESVAVKAIEDDLNIEEVAEILADEDAIYAAVERELLKDAA